MQIVLQGCKNKEREETYDEIREPINMEFTEKSRNKDFGGGGEIHLLLNSLTNLSRKIFNQ